MEVQERILKKALELYTTMGIKNITMDTIAAELGVSKRTIYELFTDKTNLVKQAVKEMVEDDRVEMMEIISESRNVVEALYLIGEKGRKRRGEICPAFIKDIQKYYPQVQEIILGDKKNYGESVTYTLLKKGTKEGIFRKDLNLDLVNVFIHEMMAAMHNQELYHSMKITPDDIMHNIFLPYWMGIATDKGQALIREYFENKKL